MARIADQARAAEKEWQRRNKMAYQQARTRVLINAGLIATMIGAAIYAPVAASPRVAGGVADGCAWLLAKRGVDWRTAWAEAWALVTETVAA